MSMKSSLIARVAAALSVLAITAVAAPAFADVYYLEIPPGGVMGPEPKGDISQKPPAMFKLTSFSIGVGHPENIGSATGGAGAGKATMQSMTVTGVDSDAATSLFQDYVSDKHLPEVRLVVGKNVSGKVVPLYIYLMKNVSVSSDKIHANAKDASPVDTYGLNFMTISYEQSTVDPSKPLGSDTLTKMGWNQVQNLPAP
jgi:type VI protein secretion system component Hcp